MKDRVLPIRIKKFCPIELSLSNITSFFKNYEKSILTLTPQKMEITISLVGIENSTGTTFYTSSLQFEEYKKAYFTFVDCIKKLKNEKIILGEISGYLKEIINLTRKNQWWIEFGDEKGETLAEMTPEISLPIVEMKGYTEICGIIEKVGGKEPHIVVRLLNDKTTSVKVKPEEAKKAANYLYEKIYINGLGKWNAEGELISIIPEEIRYFHKPTKERIEETRKKLSTYWKNVNVEAFLKELRAE